MFCNKKDFYVKMRKLHELFQRKKKKRQIKKFTAIWKIWPKMEKNNRSPKTQEKFILTTNFE